MKELFVVILFVTLLYIDIVTGPESWKKGSRFVRVVIVFAAAAAIVDFFVGTIDGAFGIPLT